MGKTWRNAIAFFAGGGSGIGRALSRELARRGARVTVADVNGVAAAKVAAAIGDGVSWRALDVRDAATVREATGRRLLEAFAGPPYGGDALAGERLDAGRRSVKA